MAKPSGVTIDISIGIPADVARLCLHAVEIYLNQNAEFDIQGRQRDDGTIKLEFVLRDDPRWDGYFGKAVKQEEPLVRVKRPDEMTPEHRKELGL